ncbi:MAG: radical SAM protein [Deltaproteobacteria bacterium]
MRVLLTSAPEPGLGAETAQAWLPLALVHLAGAVRAAGHDCGMVDAVAEGLDVPSLASRVREFDPDTVCISSSTPGFPSALELCQQVRRPGLRTIVGGVHASSMYPEFLPGGEVDFVVVGEGEETLPELLRCLEAGDDPARVAGLAFPLGGRVIRTAHRPRLAALDPLPKAWDILDAPGYRCRQRPDARLAAVATSRGCPRRCAHCFESATNGGVWRKRSVDSVAYEFTTLRRERGVEVVALQDPAPTADPERFTALLERVVELDLGLEFIVWTCVPDLLRDESRLAAWREAGVIHVGICREPGEDRLAGEARKQSLADGRRAVRALRQAGITSETSFWVGFPDETPARVEETLERAVAWSSDEARFAVLAPLPYTRAWKEWGAHVATRDYRRFNEREAVLKPRAMRLDDVTAAAEDCSRRFRAARSNS